MKQITTKVTGSYECMTTDEHMISINGMSFNIIYGSDVNGGFVAIPNHGICVPAGEPYDVKYNTEQLENCVVPWISSYAKEIALAVKQLYV